MPAGVLAATSFFYSFGFRFGIFDDRNFDRNRCRMDGMNAGRVLDCALCCKVGWMGLLLAECMRMRTQFPRRTAGHGMQQEQQQQQEARPRRTRRLRLSDSLGVGRSSKCSRHPFAVPSRRRATRRPSVTSPTPTPPHHIHLVHDHPNPNRIRHRQKLAGALITRRSTHDDPVSVSQAKA